MLHHLDTEESKALIAADEAASKAHEETAAKGVRAPEGCAELDRKASSEEDEAAEESTIPLEDDTETKEESDPEKSET